MHTTQGEALPPPYPLGRTGHVRVPLAIPWIVKGLKPLNAVLPLVTIGGGEGSA